MEGVEGVLGTIYRVRRPNGGVVRPLICGVKVSGLTTEMQRAME